MASARAKLLLEPSRMVEFAADSPLEQAGFEPSVPRDTTNFQEAAVCHLGLPHDFAPTEESRERTEAGSNHARREKNASIQRCVKWLTHRTGSERLFGTLLPEVSGASAIRRAHAEI